MNILHKHWRSKLNNQAISINVFKKMKYPWAAMVLFNLETDIYRHINKEWHIGISLIIFNVEIFNFELYSYTP